MPLPRFKGIKKSGVIQLKNVYSMAIFEKNLLTFFKSANKSDCPSFPLLTQTLKPPQIPFLLLHRSYYYFATAQAGRQQQQQQQQQ